MASTAATAVLTGALTGSFLVPVATAAPVPGPSSPGAAPAVVESANPYVGQTVCDPTAKPGTKALAAMLLAYYGTGRNGGISRPCSTGGQSEHKEGRALDWMLDVNNPRDKAVADQFLAWLTAVGPDGKPGYNARRLGVMYVIWNRQQWAVYRDSGWRAYTGASPHTDHIHISLGWNGAMGRTSWWTGKVGPVEYGPCVVVQGQTPPSYSAPNYTKCPAPLPVTSPPPPSTTTPPPVTGTTHRVVAGDTLYRLSVTYGTTVTAIKAANGLTSDTIHVGQVLTIPVGSTATTRFVDVSARSPFAADIAWLTSRGITTGVGDGTRFEPTAPVERQQMAAFLRRLSGAGNYVPPATSPFTDVPRGRALYPDVAWLVQRGITRGVGDGTRFEPTAPVERQHMAAFLFRLSGDSGYRPPSRSRFSDVPPSHPFYREISWLADRGITTGVGDGSRFGPRDAVERQHMAAFLHRYAG